VGDARNAAHARNVLVGNVEGVGVERGNWIEFTKIVKRSGACRKFVNIAAESVFARCGGAESTNVKETRQTVPKTCTKKDGFPGMAAILPKSLFNDQPCFRMLPLEQERLVPQTRFLRSGPKLS
jgi:hypothetical protein